MTFFFEKSTDLRSSSLRGEIAFFARLFRGQELPPPALPSSTRSRKPFPLVEDLALFFSSSETSRPPLRTDYFLRLFLPGRARAELSSLWTRITPSSPSFPLAGKTGRRPFSFSFPSQRAVVKALPRSPKAIFFFPFVRGLHRVPLGREKWLFSPSPSGAGEPRPFFPSLLKRPEFFLPG